MEMHRIAGWIMLGFLVLYSLGNLLATVRTEASERVTPSATSRFFSLLFLVAGVFALVELWGTYA